MLEFILGGMIGAAAGFIAAAIMGTGKINALNNENWRLSVEAWDRDKKLERVGAEAYERGHIQGEKIGRGRAN